MTDRPTVAMELLGWLGLLACSTGCPAVTPVIDPPTSDEGRLTSGTSASDPVDESETRAVDELGRLLTGPGLCEIRGGEVDRDGIGAELSITYDGQGRPETATAVLTPNCTREDPEPSDDVLFGQVGCDGQTQTLTQSLRWVWDPDGALVEVVHTLEGVPDPGHELLPDNLACTVGETPFVIQHDQWRYDADGRVIGWEQTSTDCEGVETIEETLQYGRGVVDVTRVGPTGTFETRFELDGRGHVAAAGAVRYGYDELGRLVAETLADGTSRSWSYEASLVAEHDRTWTQAVSADKRTITLERGAADERVLIGLDGEGRPETLSFDDERWSLGYGDCPNADRASARWLVHAIFEAWPFPDTPQAGDALEQHDAWTQRELPLHTF